MKMIPALCLELWKTVFRRKIPVGSSKWLLKRIPPLPTSQIHSIQPPTHTHFPDPLDPHTLPLPGSTPSTSLYFRDPPIHTLLLPGSTPSTSPATHTLPASTPSSLYPLHSPSTVPFSGRQNIAVPHCHEPRRALTRPESDSIQYLPSLRTSALIHKDKICFHSYCED